LHPPPAYDGSGRDAFYATLAKFAGLLVRQGLIVIVAATAHERRYRERGRSVANTFLEVLVDTDPAECARRDSKRLYARVAAGRISNVPGADLAYERPEAPDVVARGGHDDDAVRAIVEQLERAGLVSSPDPGEFLALKDGMTTVAISKYMTPSPHSIGS